MQKSNPIASSSFYDEEKEIMRRINPAYRDPIALDAEQTNKMRAIEGNILDPYMRTEAECLNAISHGGYLRAPGGRGGYINPPTGGFPPLLAFAPLIASILGSGTKTGGYVHIEKPLNMSNAKNFYKSLHSMMREKINPTLVERKFDKLFGSGWKKYKNSKDGGAIVDDLRMGHLLHPILKGHVGKIFKGTGINPELFLKHLEDSGHPILDMPVNYQTLQRGGSILGSLWSGLKSVLSKGKDIISNIFKNPKVQEIGKNVVGKVTKVVEERAPEIAEMGANKLADYVSKRLRGNEPIENKSKKVVDEEEDYELPAGKSSSDLRKKLVEDRRKSQSLVEYEPKTKPVKEERFSNTWKPGMTHKGTDPNTGDDIWGYGKRRGGWTLRL